MTEETVCEVCGESYLNDEMIFSYIDDLKVCEDCAEAKDEGIW